MLSPVDVKVGDVYSVPCVNDRHYGIVPIILPLHTDKGDLCLEDLGPHYHIDFRFIDDELRDKLNNDGTNGVSPKSIEGSEFLCDKMAHTSDFVSVAWPFFVNKWFTEKSDSMLLEDRICPHQGCRVTNKDGICPAHGLRWNLKNKKLESYKPPFYFQFKNGPKGKIIDGCCEIKFEKSYVVEDLNLYLIDSEDKIYSGSVFDLSDNLYIGFNFIEGEKFIVRDKNCG